MASFCATRDRPGQFGKQGRQAMWNAMRSELREFVWLASMVGGLSVAGVGLAVVLAMALVHVPH